MCVRVICVFPGPHVILSNDKPPSISNQSWYFQKSLLEEEEEKPLDMDWPDEPMKRYTVEFGGAHNGATLQTDVCPAGAPADPHVGDYPGRAQAGRWGTVGRVTVDYGIRYSDKVR